MIDRTKALLLAEAIIDENFPTANRLHNELLLSVIEKRIRAKAKKKDIEVHLGEEELEDFLEDQARDGAERYYWEGKLDLG